MTGGHIFTKRWYGLIGLRLFFFCNLFFQHHIMVRVSRIPFLSLLLLSPLRHRYDVPLVNISWIQVIKKKRHSAFLTCTYMTLPEGAATRAVKPRRWWPCKRRSLIQIACLVSLGRCLYSTAEQLPVTEPPDCAVVTLLMNSSTQN